MTLSEKRIAKILALSDGGLSDYSIAKTLNISRSTVQNYLKQNVNNVDPAFPTVDNEEITNLQQNLKTKKLKHEISTIPLEKPDVVMAPTLKRKLESLGIMDRSDIRNNLKSLYLLLNKNERYMLKVYIGKCVSHSNQLIKESERELVDLAKIKLDELYDEVESGKISEEYYESESEDVLLLVESELDL